VGVERASPFRRWSKVEGFQPEQAMGGSYTSPLGLEALDLLYI
jgi:hypothetical protein